MTRLVPKFGRRDQPVSERLMHYVLPEPNSGCWLWGGSVDQCGYGLTSVRGRTERAHRVSYKLFVGSIPKGMQLDHLCRVPCCVNPDHLEVVTKQENFLRGIPFRKKPKACPHGHPYTPENSIYSKGGYRTCRECSRLRSQAVNWRKRGIPARQMTER